MSNRQNNKVQNCIWVIDLLLLLGLFCSSVYLFYHQALGFEHAYHSDLPDHIEVGREGGTYSLMTRIFYGLLLLWDNVFIIALCLGIVVVLTVWANYWTLQVLLGRVGSSLCKPLVFLASLCMLFISSIYIPGLFPHVYAESSCTQPWHNSTYTLMRFFAVLCFGVYIQIEERYLRQLTLKDWLLFSVLLTLANWSKPSYLIAFAPVMLLFLVVDFVKGRTKGTVQMIKFGTCVLVSLPICFSQATSLWPEEQKGGVLFSPETLWAFLTDPASLMYVLAGLSFPLAVTVVCLIRKTSEKKGLLLSWLLYIVSELERLLFLEYGKRATHGNFGWGRRIGAYLLFMVCMVKCVQLYRERKIGKVVLALLLLLFGANLAQGLQYYSRLVLGGYFYY